MHDITGAHHDERVIEKAVGQPLRRREIDRLRPQH
jgi:hypothetical protein